MAVREITGGTESAVKFGGIDRSNGTPLGYWQELYGMDFTAFPALKTVKPFSYKALADGITGYIIKNGEIVYTKADGIYISGVKTAVNRLCRTRYRFCVCIRTACARCRRISFL